MILTVIKALKSRCGITDDEEKEESSDNENASHNENATDEENTSDEEIGTRKEPVRMKRKGNFVERDFREKKRKTNDPDNEDKDPTYEAGSDTDDTDDEIIQKRKSKRRLSSDDEEPDKENLDAN